MQITRHTRTAVTRLRTELGDDLIATVVYTGVWNKPKVNGGYEAHAY